MELSSSPFCQLTGLPLYDVLIRPHKGPRTISSSAQATNLKGSIALYCAVVNQSNILLLDDVVTTEHQLRSH